MVSYSSKSNLVNTLAQLYYRDPDIERVVSTAGLDLSMIAWDERPINTWRSVLAVSEDQGQVDALLSTIHQEKGGNDALRSAIEMYRQTGTIMQPSDQPQSGASVRHLKTRLGELQRRSETLTKRIAALDTDIGRALLSLDRQVLEERRSDLESEREQIEKEIGAIERRLTSDV